MASSGSMSIRRSLFSLVDRAARAHPTQIAVRSPFQRGSGLEVLSYADLRRAGLQLAGRLFDRIGSKASNGGKPIPAVVSDLPNTVENLVLQVACSRLSVAYATVKDAKMLGDFMADGSSLVNFVHSVPASTESWLHSSGQGSQPESTSVEDLFKELLSGSEEEGPVLTEGCSGDEDRPHACFNTATKPLREREMMMLATDAQKTLQLLPTDKVCVSITLCHPFGIASGVGSVFSAGSTLVLPAVGGIRGCGVPAERAEACLKVLQEEECSVLFSDAPIIKQLEQLPSGNARGLELPHLRTGVVKTGSGGDFLEEKIRIGGTELWTMGKKK